MNRISSKLSCYLAPSVTKQYNNTTPLKGTGDCDIIEVPETPESVILKKQYNRNDIKPPVYDLSPQSSSSLTSPQMETKRRVSIECLGSPINLPRKRLKRRICDSDDDINDADNDGNDSKGIGVKSDDIGIISFEDKCESAIRELKNLFPEIDFIELQDVLLECDWDVNAASRKLGNVSGDGGDGPDDTDNEVIVNDDLVKSNAIVSKNDDRMKDLSYYRKEIPCEDFYGLLWDDDDRDAPSSSSKMLSLKNRKKFKAQKNFNDDCEVISSGSDESGDDFEKDDILGECFDSDEDSGDERYKPKQKNEKKEKIKNTIKIGDLRKKVVSFLMEADVSELLCVNGLSQKKIDIINDMRPFTDWNDLRYKFENHNILSSNLLNNCVVIIKARDVIERLMNLCQQISNDIGQRVDNLKELEQPKLLNPDMHLSHYQLIGLHWLVLMFKKKLNAILADEMGLGKTIQVIALLAYLRENHKIKGHHLIVVPASILDNWMREIQLWCPSIKLLLYYGSQEERNEMRQQITSQKIEFDVIVTTYNMVYGPEDKKLFKRKVFEYVIFDEAHMLKNMRSNRYAGLMNIKGKRRLLLTGTPLQNNLLELMSLLIFTIPEMFQGKTDHVKVLFTHSNKETHDRSSFVKDKIEQAKMIMKPFVLRRLKDDVLKDLPTKYEHKLLCPMTPVQESKYMELIENFTREIRYRSKNVFEDNEYDDKYCTFKKGSSMLMGLRKAANHPLLLRKYYDDSKLRLMAKSMIKEPSHRDAEPKLIFEDMQVMHDFELYRLCKKYDSLAPYRMDTKLIEDSGKFQELDSLMKTYKYEGNRILLFSQFTMMLDIIEEFMRMRRYKYLRLDGDTKVADRIDLIDKFNNDDSVFVFLLSTRAGGLGINLASANVVIIHDIDFNPYNDKQAEDRCHRVGQTKEVIVYRLLSLNTVEEGMLKIAEEKLKLGRDVSSYANKVSVEEVESNDVRTLLRAALGI